ncbi:type I restriction endonuclease subunit R [Acetanaerobacterium elongatum]|uniref:Type I restriction enzyme endonuclease subunit n=1 Tax=Acetanaerobacterium elongatum TaxID=258515 RepID=A0A1H0CF63_9FIRM|nr:type I restriction endonuclease subunit R [Acetanaerobacterium elongatum]SDN56463.1 type I restriction enzyme, R subunit [Acetanaerobacterium elongatum]
MSQYNIVASTNESTVVAEYEPQTTRSDAYQSEAALEAAFIMLLTEQGYTYLPIHSSEELVANLRLQLEKLNDFKFTDDEWQRFFSQSLANANDGIVEKTRKIQEDSVQVLKRDDGSSKNITLIDKKNVHNNYLQVINQYAENGGNFDNRYDVTVLVNGLPLVHIELKRRGVKLKEAFNQIDRYQRDSFWAGHSLFEYVQIFVISNGTHTKYYSNTTRVSAIKEKEGGKRKAQKTSHSFEFTSFWADAKNKVIPDIVDFTKTFFAKNTILSILAKYCVLTSDDELLVMRPYQIAATERIINRIEIAKNYKRMGCTDAGGYIWHTTGSGKTLTSFKTAQIASKLPDIDKVLFVVDRKDLDYQTMKEYDRFEKGAANGNRSTKILQRQLENKDNKGNPHEYKIIVTTIQKLDSFIMKNPQHPIFNSHVVLIFDECHRSQFGDMHIRIAKNFKKYHIFGFTGTPIFTVNAGSGGNPNLRTTAQAFGDKLHTYTIVDAINDKNVLPFRIDFINTVKSKDGSKDKKVEAINTDTALLAPERISEIVTYILDHFDQKTKRNTGFYCFSKLTNIEAVAKSQDTKEEKEKVRMNGFNSIFAVSSIDAAKLYYTEFKRQMAASPEKALRIATIYSYGQNEDDPDGFLDDENSDSTDELDVTSREFLENAIKDYNKLFKTAYDTSPDKFPNYYKDLSLRMKNREIDLLIVVNMFLTGFDATTLNTLWVDKNLKQHGLIQAFSRTNRILNSVKNFGNIVCFRNLQEETDKAIALFGDKDASSIVLLKSYNDYYYGYDDEYGKHQKGYEERIAELIQKYPIGQQIIGEGAEKDFIASFGNILRLRNILSSFDDFGGKEILAPIDFQDYTGIYNDLYDKYRVHVDKENIQDDIVFEMELVRQIEVNIDYILMLVAQYHQSNCKDKAILIAIGKAIKSSLELRSKKELIEHFIETINAKTDVQKDWQKFVIEQKEADLTAIITEENLKPDEARKFIENSLRDGTLKTTGTDIDKIMPPVSRFGSGSRAAKKQGIIEKLKVFFEKYFGLM